MKTNYNNRNTVIPHRKPGDYQHPGLKQASSSKTNTKNQNGNGKKTARKKNESEEEEEGEEGEEAGEEEEEVEQVGKKTVQRNKGKQPATPHPQNTRTTKIDNTNHKHKGGSGSDGDGNNSPVLDEDSLVMDSGSIPNGKGGNSAKDVEHIIEESEEEEEEGGEDDGSGDLTDRRFRNRVR